MTKYVCVCMVAYHIAGDIGVELNLGDGDFLVDHQINIKFQIAITSE